MGIFFFKIPKNKRFNYAPLFYDEKKEEMEQRHNTHNVKDTDEYRRYLKDKIHYRWRKKPSADVRRSSRIRSLIIIGIMLVLAYLVFGQLLDMILFF